MQCTQVGGYIGKSTANNLNTCTLRSVQLYVQYNIRVYSSMQYTVFRIPVRVDRVLSLELHRSRHINDVSE